MGRNGPLTRCFPPERSSPSDGPSGRPKEKGANCWPPSILTTGPQGLRSFQLPRIASPGFLIHPAVASHLARFAPLASRHLPLLSRTVPSLHHLALVAGRPGIVIVSLWHLSYPFLKPLSVSASWALLRSLTSLLCSAFSSFLSGIFFPAGTPSSLCRAPGCFIAPAIHFFAMASPPGARAPHGPHWVQL